MALEKIKERWDGLLYKQAIRSLNRKINTILEIAKGYENESLATGSKEYNDLYSEAIKHLAQFQLDYGTDISELRLGMPGLLHLQNLAYNKPAPKPNYVGMFAGAAAALIVLGALATCILAGYTDLFYHLTH